MTKPLRWIRTDKQLHTHTCTMHNKPNNLESGYNKLARLMPPPPYKTIIYIIIAPVHLVTVETPAALQWVNFIA